MFTNHTVNASGSQLLLHRSEMKRRRWAGVYCWLPLKLMSDVQGLERLDIQLWQNLCMADTAKMAELF